MVLGTFIANIIAFGLILIGGATKPSALTEDKSLLISYILFAALLVANIASLIITR